MQSSEVSKGIIFEKGFMLLIGCLMEIGAGSLYSDLVSYNLYTVLYEYFDAAESM